jgi:hypothetical protein
MESIKTALSYKVIRLVISDLKVILLDLILVGSEGKYERAR